MHGWCKIALFFAWIVLWFCGWTCAGSGGKWFGCLELRWFCLESAPFLQVLVPWWRECMGIGNFLRVDRASCGVRLCYVDAFRTGCGLWCRNRIEFFPNRLHKFHAAILV